MDYDQHALGVEGENKLNAYGVTRELRKLPYCDAWQNKAVSRGTLDGQQAQERLHVKVTKT